MSMTTENLNEEVVMENQEAVEVVGQPEESKIKKVWNKIKKPLGYTVIALVGFGIGLASNKFGSTGSLEIGDQATGNIVE